jgi:hypothetical protein
LGWIRCHIARQLIDGLDPGADAARGLGPQGPTVIGRFDGERNFGIRSRRQPGLDCAAQRAAKIRETKSGV